MAFFKKSLFPGGAIWKILLFKHILNPLFERNYFTNANGNWNFIRTKSMITRICKEKSPKINIRGGAVAFFPKSQFQMGGFGRSDYLSI